MTISAKVTIIIPLYNKEKTITRAVQSVLNQTLTGWRLIVVDDGSTDKGPEIIKGIIDPRIEIIHQINAGPGAARNTGIKLADSTFVAFLDGDDEWYPDNLKNALTAIESDDVSMIGAMYDETHGRKNIPRIWARQGITPGVYSFKGNENPCHIEALLAFFHVDTTLIKTKIALKYGGFFENRCRYGEDTVFFLRIGMNEPFKIINSISACRHLEDSDLTRPTPDIPLPPHLVDPKVVLDYCGGPKRVCMSRIIDYLAVHRARWHARNGRKKEAIHFLQRFPEARRVGWLWWRCRWEIALSPILPLWVKFKMAIRKWLRLPS